MSMSWRSMRAMRPPAFKRRLKELEREVLLAGERRRTRRVGVDPRGALAECDLAGGVERQGRLLGGDRLVRRAGTARWRFA
jgi:hypothetical protein